jgi:hypothetical protein
MRVRDHRQIRYKARFWPLYAMSYHKAKRASQSENNFRMSLIRDDIMILGFYDLNAYTYERRIWPTQLGGQLWGTWALSFDNSVRYSLDVVRHSQPSSSYNRLYDPTESALRALPHGTWQIPGEFYREYIALPILEFTFSQQRCVNAWIIAQYGLTRQEVEGVSELDWLRTQPVEFRHSPTWSNTRIPRNSSSSSSNAPLTTTSLSSESFNLMRPLRGSTNCCENGIWLNCRTMRNLLRRSRIHSILCDLTITRRYAFSSSYRQVKGRTYDQSNAGRPIVDCIYVSGYASNGQYYKPA